MRRLVLPSIAIALAASGLLPVVAGAQSPGAARAAFSPSDRPLQPPPAYPGASSPAAAMPGNPLAGTTTRLVDAAPAASAAAPGTSPVGGGPTGRPGARSVVPPAADEADPIASTAASAPPGGRGAVPANPVGLDGDGPIPDLKRLQSAWTSTKKTDNQVDVGVRALVWSGEQARPWTLQVRDLMSTWIQLPADDPVAGVAHDNPIAYAIHWADDGDKADADIPPSVVILHAKVAGLDTTLHIYTRAGRRYSFIVQSHDYRYEQPTDVVVTVTRDDDLAAVTRRAPAPAPGPAPAAVPGAAGSPPAVGRPRAITRITGQVDSDAPQPDLCRQPDDPILGPPPKPNPAHGPLRAVLIQVPSDHPDYADIAPDYAYRNDRFLFLDYRCKVGRGMTLPAPARVRPDGTPEVVVSPRTEGGVMVVYPAGDYVLLQGRRFVCISDPAVAATAATPPVKTP